MALPPNTVKLSICICQRSEKGAKILWIALVQMGGTDKPVKTRTITKTATKKETLIISYGFQH